jgi:hypothetical protein
MDYQGLSVRKCSGVKDGDMRASRQRWRSKNHQSDGMEETNARVMTESENDLRGTRKPSSHLE